MRDGLEPPWSRWHRLSASSDLDPLEVSEHGGLLAAQLSPRPELLYRPDCQGATPNDAVNLAAPLVMPVG